MDVANIERELAEIWTEAATGEDAVVRACMLNLVVVCKDGDWDLEAATKVVAGISETAPCRAIVLAPDGCGSVPDGLDAYFSPHCHRGGGGRLVCSEQITMRYDDLGVELIPETVLQLLVEELPVVCWWRPVEVATAPLLTRILGFADVLLIDSGSHGDSAAGVRALNARMSSGSFKGHAADATWARVEPWREAIAALFDLPEHGPWLDHVTTLTIVEGGVSPNRSPGGAALYLAGWLAARLQWTAEGRTGEWKRRDGTGVRLDFLRDPQAAEGEICEACIEATQDGDTATFEARRVPDHAEVVELSVRGQGPCAPPTRIKLPARDVTALLCGTLQQAELDSIFAPALAAAARIGGKS